MVVDNACADGLNVDPAAGRCLANGASVDSNTCKFSSGRSAFYYVRVLMNLTCRWSSYEAIRLTKVRVLSPTSLI